MNRDSLKGAGALMLAIAVAALVLSGCATSPKVPANVQNVQCTAKKIAWEVAPEAEIANFDCQMGTQAGDPALIITMDLKNVSDKPLRYKVQVFLQDMDKAFGHLVPRKGKPPVVAPGATEKVKIPFLKTEMASKDILVMVKAMSGE